MMTQTLAEVSKAKVEVLLNSSADFVKQVEVTAHLDQKALVSKAVLPRETENFRVVPWEDLCQRWGLRIIGNINADLFAVEMPLGWLLRPLAHDSLWSGVYDERGRERATIYYQPTAADHSAILYLAHRFNVFSHYLDPTDHTVRIISARDGARIFHEFGRVAAGDRHYFDDVARYEAQARLWFDREFPGWRDPFAYWELEP